MSLEYYFVYGEVTISTWTKVRASSPEEAKLKAEDREMVGLCHQCASDRGSKESWVTSGELDGTPVIKGVEKA